MADLNTKLLCHFNSVDGSVSHPLTMVGGAVLSNTQYKFGDKGGFPGSIIFDGSGDYITTPDHADWYYSGDFTIDCWIYVNNVATADQTIVNQSNSTLAENEVNWFAFDAGNLRFRATDSGGSNLVNLIAASGMSSATWYHVAIVRSGNDFTLYVNGSSIGTTTAAVTLENWTGLLYIGAGVTASAVSRYFNGYIDELRISKTARWTANFTPSARPYTSDSSTCLLIHANGAGGSNQLADMHGGDESGTVKIDSYDYIITYVGDAQLDTAQSKFGSSSLLLDGTGDYLTIRDTTDWQLGGGTGDFAIDLWVRFNSVASSQVFVQQSVDANNYWQLLYNQTSGLLQFGFTEAAVDKILVTGSWSPSTATWYHVAITRDGNNFRLFVDGSQVGITVVDADSFANFAGLLYVGSNAGSTQFFNGWMDELRISNSARWTTTFTPPTVQYTNPRATVVTLA